MAITPTISTIASAVKTELDTITDIGNVHARPRDEIQPGDFDDLYIYDTTNSVRAAIIDITASNSVEDPSGNLFIVSRTVEVKYYVQFDQVNDSETTFRDLVDLIQSKINRNASIFGACPLVADTGVTTSIEFAQLGTKLCHLATFEFIVESQEVVS